ncbi:MAG: DUF4956 domain-containing protein [Bacteroidota bacterium]
MTALINNTFLYEFFGIQLFEKLDFFELVVRFIFNLVITVIIVRWLYYSIAKRKDYLFTYILISTITFLLCYMLGSVKLQLGFALGLFAIFGIIRYRTSQIPIKEMTYLFIIIGVSVINALSNKKISYSELLFTNLIIIFITWILEKVWLLRHESMRQIIYEKIDLIKPENKKELHADLENRTGLKISRVEIGRIDFLRDTARLRIYFFESDQEYFTDDMNNVVDDDDD